MCLWSFRAIWQTWSPNFEWGKWSNMVSSTYLVIWFHHIHMNFACRATIRVNICVFPGVLETSLTGESGEWMHQHRPDQRADADHCSANELRERNWLVGRRLREQRLCLYGCCGESGSLFSMLFRPIIPNTCHFQIRIIPIPIAHGIKKSASHHPNWRTHIFERGGSTTNQISTGLWVNISITSESPNYITVEHHMYIYIYIYIVYVYIVYVGFIGVKPTLRMAGSDNNWHLHRLSDLDL